MVFERVMVVDCVFFNDPAPFGNDPKHPPDPPHPSAPSASVPAVSLYRDAKDSSSARKRAPGSE
jgi:hypothetical protein